MGDPFEEYQRNLATVAPSAARAPSARALRRRGSTAATPAANPVPNSVPENTVTEIVALIASIRSGESPEQFGRVLQNPLLARLPLVETNGASARAKLKPAQAHKILQAIGNNNAFAKQDQNALIDKLPETAPDRSSGTMAPALEAVYSKAALDWITKAQSRLYGHGSIHSYPEIPNPGLQGYLSMASPRQAADLLKAAQSNTRYTGPVSLETFVRLYLPKTTPRTAGAELAQTPSATASPWITPSLPRRFDRPTLEEIKVHIALLHTVANDLKHGDNPLAKFLPGIISDEAIAVIVAAAKNQHGKTAENPLGTAGALLEALKKHLVYNIVEINDAIVRLKASALLAQQAATVRAKAVRQAAIAKEPLVRDIITYFSMGTLTPDSTLVKPNLSSLSEDQIIVIENGLVKNLAACPTNRPYAAIGLDNFRADSQSSSGRGLEAIAKELVGNIATTGTLIQLQAATPLLHLYSEQDQNQLRVDLTLNPLVTRDEAGEINQSLQDQQSKRKIHPLLRQLASRDAQNTNRSHLPPGKIQSVGDFGAALNTLDANPHLSTEDRATLQVLLASNLDSGVRKIVIDFFEWIRERIIASHYPADLNLDLIRGFYELVQVYARLDGAPRLIVEAIRDQSQTWCGSGSRESYLKTHLPGYDELIANINASLPDEWRRLK